MSFNQNPITLIILDGWGIAPASKGNAISKSNIPNLKNFLDVYPSTQLEASGESVGLPRGEPGNSEAGHINLGAGSIVFQSLPRINLSIADGSFFLNKALLAASHHVKKNNSKIHFLGLLGSGGVHSNIEHLFALLRWAKEQKIEQVFLHLFTDGRDSPPTACLDYLNKVEEVIKSYHIGEIATIMGRFYAMDRDNRWDRTKIAYEALTEGKGLLTENYVKVVEESYNLGKTDEFIEPIILSRNGKPKYLISDNDAVIFFNFRIDRPRQLTKAFVLSDFESLVIKKRIFDPYAERYGKRQYEDEEKDHIPTFKRNIILKNLLFVTMTQYEPALPIIPIFSPTFVNNTLPEVLAQHNLRQLHIAETEKERHVCYYFDGKRESPFEGEDWVVIDSPKVRTYDLKPEMSAYQVTEEAIKRIQLDIYNFIIINFANPDMVGHSGNFTAAIKACEVTDECLGKVVNTVLGSNGTCLITADHGNIEEMIDLKSGEIDTKHSTNPVPFILVNKNLHNKPNLRKGILADVAPTILKLANIEKPVKMTGKSLI